MIPKNRLLLNESFGEFFRQNPLQICDVGARGELFKPFNQVPDDRLKIFGFEPDAKEAERLSKIYDPARRVYFPTGLWEKTEAVKLSYARHAGNSSIHPPDMERLKALFPNQHWDTRDPKEIIDIHVSSLDDIAAEHPMDCDLLKVDTQGSEYEILKGAEKQLSRSISFVLLETWTFEVHKGQALSGKIMEWMNGRGFELVRVYQGADWHRKQVSQLEEPGLRTLIGLDLLFARRTHDTAGKSVKAASLAELYGFPDLALQILENAPVDTDQDKTLLTRARSIITQNWKKKQENLLFRAARKVLYLMGYKLEKIKPSEHAPLH